MFDGLIERISLRKTDLQRLAERFSHVSFDYDWNALPKEADSVCIAGSDGSVGVKKFLSCGFYAISAESVMFDSELSDSKLSTMKASDLGFLLPYRFVEDRVRLYMGLLELKVVLKTFQEKKPELGIIDGSIIGNIVRPFPIKLSPRKDMRELVEREFLDKLTGGGLEIQSTKLYEEVSRFGNVCAHCYLEYLEYLCALRDVLKYNVIGISKTSTSNTIFKADVPDIAIFSSSTNVGYSNPKYVNISDSLKRSFPILENFFRGKEFTVFYVRLQEKKNVLKIEIPFRASKDEVENIIAKLMKISVDGYPYVLRKAHNDVVIKKKDMERIINILGLKERTGREML
jgi:NurA-like 5'-3' nuclease